MTTPVTDRDVKGAERTASGDLLLERDRELAEIDEFVGAVEGSGSRLLLVEGQAGIGKSTLLAEAGRLAGEDGIRSLVARGSLLEREFPFGVVRQLFEPQLAPPGERERLLAGAAAPARTVFESVPGEAGGDASFAAPHGLFRVTIYLSRVRPLMLFIQYPSWVRY